MSTAKTALIIGASRGLGKVQIEQLDMDDQQAVIALSQKLKDQVFDLLFVNAGVKGPDNQLPGQATLAEVGQLFFTNAVAPINLPSASSGRSARTAACWRS